MNQNTSLSLTLSVFVLAAPIAPSRAQTPDATTLALSITGARPGQTITLPAGTFAMGLTLPPGVSLRGAGYGKTIIDASIAKNGIDVNGGAGAVISDLTVRGAGISDILAQNAQRLTISRVRTTGSLLGGSFNGVTGGRIENVISDNNRYGIVVTGGEDNTVVNCTLAKNASLGFSFPSGTHATVFNNVVAESATCIYMGQEAREMHIDHNLYLGLYAGKFHEQLARKTVGAWSYMSGQDSHSVHLPVVFAGAEDFRPTNLLPWSQERVATSDWGVAEIDGARAPTADIEGHTRVGAPDLGVYEIAPTPARPADGVLNVRGGEGLTSAGVFAPDGTAVTYLFQNMPLARGKYRFWLPARTYQGQPLAAGKYELRMVESNLKWEYLGWVGNSYSGASLANSVTAPTDSDGVAIDNARHIIAGKGITEDHISLRGLDQATGQGLWTFKGGEYMRGLAVGPDGLIYVFRSGKSLDEVRLIRSDPVTGNLVPWGDPNNLQIMLPAAQNVNGIAILGDRIYFADAGANKLWYAPLAKPALEAGFDVPAPSSPAADTRTGTIWLISAGKTVVALDPDGKIIAQFDTIASPAALAVNDGRLAVASRSTGKVHLFDVSDPHQIRPLGTVGLGDGPYGPLLPTRFRFQNAPGNENSEVYLAMGPRGALVVSDLNRIMLFDGDGKLQWSDFGMWGAGMIPSRLRPGRLWDTSFHMSFTVDGATKTWKPEAFWDFVVPTGSVFYGDFSVGGKTFALFQDDGYNYRVVRFDGFKAVPVLGFFYDPKTRVTTMRKDTNHDGKLDETDQGDVVVDGSGKPVPYPLISGYERVLGDGELDTFQCNGVAMRWKCAGLDAEGVPIYRFKDIEQFPAGPSISPYSFAKFQVGGMVSGKADPSGGFMGISSIPGSPNSALLNTGGTDLASVGPGGHVRWIKDMAEYGYVNNLVGENGVYLAGIGTTTELAALDKDGLGMGGFGWPERANWTGLWYDHPYAVMSYKGSDGRFYFVTTDYIQNLNQWFRLDDSSIRQSRTALSISDSTAQSLAALPAPDPQAAVTKPATPTVRIPHLDQDLPIDGDLVKWRTAGIVPQIIMTPDASVGIKGGPKDASAVIRLAYRDGALYGQILRFCNVVVMDQPVSRAYLQDTVEMALNGFIEGFKFNITKTTDEGDIIQRQSWYGTPETRLPAADAPRIVKVLDNARDVEERKMIESIYGEDMSDCKVIIYEFKLPINKTTYAHGEDRIFPLAPGKTFWIGFMIDDNDQPGSDVQNLLVWPVTYGTFSPKEVGAIATCE